jgi:5-methylcytosine-specific restriction enzyme A
MGKLRQLRGPLPVLKPRVSFLNDDKAAASRVRDRRHEYRAWYKTQRWKRLRWSVLVRDLFTCQRCGRVEANTALLVADHREPHRGNEVLFWDAQNLWCLCKACHDSAKQREERAAARWGGVVESLEPTPNRDRRG